LAPLAVSGIISGIVLSAFNAVGAMVAITAPFAAVFKNDLLELKSVGFM
jgi:hypothetical protein